MKRLKLLIAAALAVGFAAAALLPSSTQTQALSSNYYVWNHPGGADFLYCGWHDACETGTVQSGWALDWTGNSSVYWRSYSTNSGSASQAGYGTIISYGGNCDDTRVRVYDNGAGYQGEIRYLHVYTSYNNYNFAIYSGTTWPDWTSFYIGYTANEPYCSAWSGYHVHQQRWDGGWVKDDYPDVATCDNDNPDPAHRIHCGNYDIFTYAMLYRDWVY